MGGSYPQHYTLKYSRAVSAKTEEQGTFIKQLLHIKLKCRSNL